MRAQIPKPALRVVVGVRNPKKCIQCGGMFLTTPGYKTDECEHCEEYLDETSKDAAADRDRVRRLSGPDDDL